MEDVNISKYRASVVREGSKPASPGFVVSEGQSPTDPAGSGQNHLPVTIAPVSTALAITENQVLSGAGTVAQYIRGDGSLADFPESSGGGSSVSYYLNGSVNQGTIGGVAYKELNKVPILGAGTQFTISADGYIASFLTDAGDPNLLEIPGGNWNFETYFSASSSGGTPNFYVELYKYDGTTFTLIASSSSAPELIAFGTTLTPYFSSLAVPTTTLALTDRLAVRYYVNHSGRTITMHTENNHLCQIITTFTTGLTALNGLTAQVQNFAVGTTGTDFNIASATATHTFNLPTASATNRGALSSGDWTTFNNKQNALGFTPVPETRTITINGTTQDLSANRTYNVGTVTSVAALTLGTSGTDLSSTVANGTTTPVITLNVPTASASNRGALSSADWSTFNGKQNALTLTTTGTSGAATLVGSTLNIPIYSPDLSGYVPTSRTITINGTTQDLSANRTFNVGTVTSVGLSSATSGVTIGSTPVTGSGTITLAIATASGSQNGLLSSTDWTTFNNKQNALTNPVTGTGTTNYLPKFTGSTTIGNSQIFDNGTNVSIGATSTNGKLTVVSNPASWNNFANAQLRLGATISGNAISMLFTDGNNSNGWFGYQDNAVSANRYFYWSANDGVSQQMQLNSSGNLGLGVTPSAWGSSTFKVLDIGSTTSLYNDAGTILSENSFINSSFQYIYKTTNFASRYDQVSGNHRFFTAPSGTAGNAISFTQAMTLTSGGNLLVGTTSDNGARLQVSGTAAIGAGTQGINTDADLTLREGVAFVGLDFKSARTSGNVGGLRFYNTSSDSVAIAQQLIETDGKFVFYNGTSGAEARVTITSGGNVGIGTASPGTKLSVYANNPTTGIIFEIFNNATSSQTGAIMKFTQESVADWGIGQPAGTNAFAFWSGTYPGNLGTERARITSGGNLLVGTTTDNGARLQVSGTATVSGAYGTSSGVYLSGTTYGTYGANRGATSASAGMGYFSVGSQRWFTGIYENSDNFGFYSVGTNGFPLVINYSSGNVLIGTTTDVGARLHVNGDIRTAAPSGGSAVNWKLGTARGGTITPNAIVRVEIAGVLVDLDARYV